MSKSLLSVYAEYNPIEDFWCVIHVEPFPCLNTPIKNWDWFLLGIYGENDYINTPDNILEKNARNIYSLRMNVIINGLIPISI